MENRRQQNIHSDSQFRKNKDTDNIRFHKSTKSHAHINTIHKKGFCYTKYSYNYSYSYSFSYSRSKYVIYL